MLGQQLSYFGKLGSLTDIRVILNSTPNLSIWHLVVHLIPLCELILCNAGANHLVGITNLLHLIKYHILNFSLIFDLCHLVLSYELLDFFIVWGYVVVDRGALVGSFASVEDIQPLFLLGQVLLQHGVELLGLVSRRHGAVHQRW